MPVRQRSSTHDAAQLAAHDVSRQRVEQPEQLEQRMGCVSVSSSDADQAIGMLADCLGVTRDMRMCMSSMLDTDCDAVRLTLPARS